MTDTAQGAPDPSAAPPPDPDAPVRAPGELPVPGDPDYDPGKLILGEPRKIAPPPWSRPVAIVVDDAAKWYDRRKRSRMRAALPFAMPTEPPAGSIVALDKIDLEIGEGQSVGIIGNNGAGKSTLLRLVAGVTAPSRGTVAVRGRVASMIELGLGFHPEMTGAENLEFAAGLLGMGPATLKRRWTDIVEFSGVEHALDQPVKQYSSGMMARLGFALASHSDAEIILVDEVLSVGDFDFQRRSLERIMTLNREGRTTVIVTHNLDALPPLCQRIVQLEHGRVVADGRPKEVIPDYVAVEQKKFAKKSRAPVVISEVEVDPPSIEPTGTVTVRGVIQTQERMYGCIAALRIGFGAALMAWAGEGDQQPLERLVDEPLDIDLGEGPGRWEVEVTAKALPLFPGDYQIGLAVLESDMTEITRLTTPLDIQGVRQEWKSLRVPIEQSNRRLDGDAAVDS